MLHFFSLGLLLTWIFIENAHCMFIGLFEEFGAWGGVFFFFPFFFTPMNLNGQQLWPDFSEEDVP